MKEKKKRLKKKKSQDKSCNSTLLLSAWSLTLARGRRGRTDSQEQRSQTRCGRRRCAEDVPFSSNVPADPQEPATAFMLPIRGTRSRHPPTPRGDQAGAESHLPAHPGLLQEETTAFETSTPNAPLCQFLSLWE